MRGALASRKAWGFTLLELLVTIGMIAALLLLAVPLVQRTTEASNITRCATNLRSLGAEVLGVISENGGVLPWYEAGRGRSGMWWYKVLGRTNFEGFNTKMACPSFKDPYIYLYSPGGATLSGTYRYNKYMGYQHKNGTWIYPQVRIQNVPYPSRLALVADARYPYAHRSDDSTGFETWKEVFDCHRNQTTAVIFCLDGHIEIMTKDNPRKIVMAPQHLNR